MAVTATVVARDATSLKRVFADLAFSGTYTTGGEATTNGFLKDLSLSRIIHVNIEQGSGSTDGLVAKYNRTTNKVVLFRVDQVDDFLEELANGATLANLGTLRAEFVGEGN